ncbi:molecular chaperone HtpG [Roseibacillus persicicus]|uniref:Chaperone protein HtpG n=1 Tax=Roseibacillus persicicus TaxID=454148 RepID=A0A918WIY3_9BACT|nr:molecular chaperone HtpG [Roseibacillus persicicus]MDQ8190021.1 molecular chaperone HtpG [Roseibacillus persicicus]GHC50732.1 molecular chaperone HtpG [Roseibacillus persicicus]
MSDVQKHEFQAEVRQLLDIVIHSLYTDREIFVRELISNASDALEKMRLQQLKGDAIFDADKPLEISITTDEEAKTLTIADYGIGMTREELVANIGTIASSGTKKFLEALKENGGGADVIGQFGVGFYSAFMVADKVEVYTHSWQEDGGHLRWESDGATGYTIEESSDLSRGAKVVVHLKEEFEEFAKPETIKAIIERYSNFVGFPVKLNDEVVNTVDAIWLKPKNEVSEEDYKEFYKFVGKDYQDPRYTFHFSADAPLMINSILFVPDDTMERMGMGQTPPGVGLYCKKVLIDAAPENLLPEWLRFLKGVIDSEDLPLNISRESMQDSALVKKLGDVMTKRFIKFLEKEAKSDPAKYTEFYQRFGRFLKEGVVQSYEHQESLAGLLRFESSMTEAGTTTSLQEYVDRMKDGQTEIYYLVAPNREAIETGPYLEAFKKRGLEVAFFNDGVDDYVLETLGTWKEKKIVSADRADIELEDVADEEGEALDEAATTGLVDWMTKAVGERFEKVEAGKRLVSHAVVALTPKDAPNAQMRAMMKAMGSDAPETKARLEVNPRHSLVKKLAAFHESKPELAEKIAKQLGDNALLAAGLVENPGQVVSSMGEVLEELMD